MNSTEHQGNLFITDNSKGLISQQLYDTSNSDADRPIDIELKPAGDQIEIETYTSFKQEKTCFVVFNVHIGNLLIRDVRATSAGVAWPESLSGNAIEFLDPAYQDELETRLKLEVGRVEAARRLPAYGGQR